MIPQEIIAKKRDGKKLTDAEIHSFIMGVTSGAVSEGQIAAFAMATIWRGMDMDERVALTRAMADSGTIIDWSKSDLDGPVIDKHSTGGVGDKVSLILGPMIAACGGYVPMISGRGLGHTGGTLDKFDAIPGYQSQPDLETIRRVTKKVGVAIVGATAEIAPADKKIYAVRDVTATVESIDLITASILSKKLAAGLEALVMDVKFGTGAFMPTLEDAKDLAESLVSVANGAGLKTVALLTDMNQVLGKNAGNAIEVREAIEMLKGAEKDSRLYEVSASLSAQVMATCGLYNNLDTARNAVDKAMSSGKAAEKFALMVSELGGPVDLMENPEKYLPLAPIKHDVYAKTEGYVSKIDTRALGMAVVELGGGRKKPTDNIDFGVSLSNATGLGKKITKDSAPLCTIYAKTEEAAKTAEKRILAAYEIGETAPKIGKLIAGKVG